MNPTTALGLSIRLSMFELRETGDWDIFLGPPERSRAETGGADQWVLKRRECSGFAKVNQVTSASMGYPLSVFNKNSILKTKKTTGGTANVGPEVDAAPAPATAIIPVTRPAEIGHVKGSLARCNHSHNHHWRHRHWHSRQEINIIKNPTIPGKQADRKIRAARKVPGGAPAKCGCFGNLQLVDICPMRQTRDVNETEGRTAFRLHTIAGRRLGAHTHT